MKEKLLSILAFITIGVANMQAQTMTGVDNDTLHSLVIIMDRLLFQQRALPLPITYNYYVNGTSVVLLKVT